MNTISLISSVSFNTEAFFASNIERLHDAGLIDWCHWIYHYAEADEHKKPHIHFVLQPSRRIDTEALRKEFLESDPQNEKPRGCNPFCKSKISDWLLYAIHDANYLLNKGQSRKYHYSVDDIKSTSVDLLHEQFCDTRSPVQAKIEVLRRMYEEGFSWSDVLLRGIFAINEVYYYQSVWRALGVELCRNGGKTHDESEVSK